MKYGAAGARLETIETSLNAAGFLTIAELAATTGVSEMTVRRDVAALAAAGKVRLSHGGVHGAEPASAYQSLQSRQRLNWSAKDAIARAAALLVGPQDSIALDAGSTALRLLDRLPERFAGSVVTHSVPVIAAALERGSFRLIALGGEVYRDSAAMVGPIATEAASRLRVRSVFLGAAAIDERGVYVAADIERPTKLALMDIADQVILLADHSKFSHSAPVLLCGFDRLDCLVTEQAVPAALRKPLAAAAVQIIVGEE